MKLLDEQPGDYLKFCRQAVTDQELYIQALTTKLSKHQDDPEWNETNQLLQTYIQEQYDILNNFQLRLERARKGQYE